MSYRFIISWITKGFKMLHKQRFRRQAILCWIKTDVESRFHLHSVSMGMKTLHCHCLLLTIPLILTFWGIFLDRNVFPSNLFIQFFSRKPMKALVWIAITKYIVINLCHTDTGLTVAEDETKNMNVNFIRCQKPSFHKTEGHKKCLEIYIHFFLPSHSDDHF